MAPSRRSWFPASLRLLRVARFLYGVALLVNNVFNQRYVQFFGGQLTSIGVPYSIITPPRFADIEFTAQM